LIKKAASYLLIITALLYGIRWLHYQNLLKDQHGYYHKYKTAFLQANSYDVLFLGSSRVQMHYNARLFDSLTGSNSFNLSLSGATPKVSFAALKTYLNKSHPPKYIISDIDYHHIGYESNTIAEFNNYFPFLKDKELRNNFSEIDPRMKWFYYLPYYSLPFTGYKNISTGLNTMMGRLNKTDTLFYKGYFKECMRPALNYEKSLSEHVIPNPVELNYLDSIIQLCKKKQILISFVSSPIFGGGRLDATNKEELLTQLQTHVAKRGSDYKDLSSLEFCNRRELFVDHFHMNHIGARLFTIQLADYFSNNLQKKALMP
jgi:hypothetical protein